MKEHDRSVVFGTAAREQDGVAGKDNWRTPKALFEREHLVYTFTLDAAADATNHLCEQWLGPGSSLNEDGLKASWFGHTVWCNPPYSMCAAFIAKAATERVMNRVTSRVLVPSRTDTKWWHLYVWNEAKGTWREGVSADFIKGRVKFVDPDADAAGDGAPFPSVLITFDGSVKPLSTCTLW